MAPAWILLNSMEQMERAGSFSPMSTAGVVAEICSIKRGKLGKKV